ncbi:MAG: hypothetical protein JXA57_16820, partial [Armatimonadetes bacterium]|nr:hypothetical protein [Armatimonadota bacterium]
MQWREYDPLRDRDAVHRIWREVGWLPKGKESAVDTFLACGRALVADVDGQAECAVTTAPGLIRYVKEDLPFVEVTGVATSRVARRQGLAQRVLARALAADVADGALLSRVCVFDQGFYNRVGFGPGAYEHTISFDPATLRLNATPRAPQRLGKEDAELMHASRLARRRGHGGVIYQASGLTESEVRWSENGFGLGYRDGPNGELTHHLWCSPQNVEFGPYFVQWMSYQTWPQFLELLALLKNLGDQVRLVRMREPQGVQLQDLLERPFRHHAITDKSPYRNRMSAYAFWQVRMLDVPGCLAATKLDRGEIRFNLRLSDPIEGLLEEGASWRGVAGRYLVTLGPSSGAEFGDDAALPTLHASVNAFTRMWLGVRP